MGLPSGFAGRRAPLTAVASGASFSVLLALVVARWSPLVSIDREAVVALTEYTRAHGAYRAAMSAISEATHSQWSVLCTLLIAALMWIVKWLAESIWLMFTVGIGNAVNPLLKEVVDRPRPVLADPIGTFSGLSFPSGHAVSAMLMSSALLVLVWPHGDREVRVLSVGVAILLVMLSGGSRLVLGAHYPSDIAGGYLLGLAWVAAWHPLLSWLRTRLPRSPRSSNPGSPSATRAEEEA